MKKEPTFSTCSWMHKLVMLSCMLLVSGGLFAQHQCNAYFQQHQDSAANTVDFFASQNPFGTTYSWTFGDGGTGTGQNATYTYATPGTYYVCLTVSDSGVCTQTHCDSVRVQGPPPPPTCNAHFTQFASQHNGGVCFSTQGNAFGSQYSWTFGDGTTSNQFNPCHVYASAGVYYACLTVVDTNISGTCSDTWCDSVHVNAPPPPTCNAHFNAYTFNGSTYFAAFGNAPGTYYSWDFGDGNTSTAPNPHNTYATTGVYYVCLTVNDTNQSGTCTDTWCDSVHVGHNPPPPPPHHHHCNAHFHYFTALGNDTVTFRNSPAGPNTTYAWDFGDGTTGTGANPVHVFPDTLTYYVCVTVQDSDSTGVICTDTQCDSVRVGSHAHCFGHHSKVSEVNPVASVFPNPMKEVSTLHVENAEGTSTFRVYGFNGRIVYTKEVTNGDFAIDKNLLGTGLYFYELIDSNGGVAKGKLIIQ